MRPGAVRQSIRFKADPQLRVRSGQTVVLNVVKHLIGKKWAVSVAGRVYPAVASVELKPGQRLFAKAEVIGSRIILHLQDPGRNAVGDVHDPAGLPQDTIKRAVVLALMRQGRTVDPQTVRLMIPYVRRFQRTPNKAARTLAIAHGKGIDLDSAGLTGLLGLLMFEEDESPGGHRERNDTREDGDDTGDLATVLERNASRRDDGSALSLFNALGEEKTSWIVIPVRYDGIHGSVRLLVDRKTRRAVRLVVDVTDAGAPPKNWAFVMDGRYLAAFAEPDTVNRRIEAEYTHLRTKLQNRGIETDDSIREIGAFDGYSLHDEEHIQGINALG